jgi:hypothetical protein
MEKKQTAVQWLIETMRNGQHMVQPEIDEAIEQAIQMEREQIEESYFMGVEMAINDDAVSPSDYYTQTFNQ